MIYGKMWLVVKPTVGIPLFFAGVATASMLTHFAILTHTNWFPAFLNGNAKAKVVGQVSPDASPPKIAMLK